MFKITKRVMEVTHLNIRTQKAGKKKKGPKAVDISLKFTGDYDLLDLLLPLPEDGNGDASDFFFNDDGHVRLPTIEPLSLNRTPEGLAVTMYDRKEPLELQNANAKDFVVAFKEGGSIEVTCKVQAILERGYVERLKDILSDSVEVEITSEQEDLFAMPAAQAAKGKDENQGDLLAAALRKDEEDADGDDDDDDDQDNGEGDEGDEGDEPPIPVPPSRRAAAKAKAAPKKKAVKKKSRGKRLGA